MIQEINHLISDGDFTAALDLIDFALLEYGELYLYHEKRAEILLGLGDRAGALASLERAADLNPDSTRLQQLLASHSPEPAAVKTPRGEIESVIPAGLQSLARAAAGDQPPKRFCGILDRYPDTTGRRQAEGGLRLKGQAKQDTDEHPLVTIVTVVFNNPHSLERCVESVLGQDYPNVEYLIIDGGSAEPTLEVIRKHEARIDYYISEPDRGIYSAMNKGIQLANGRYVCLLNSDDYYDPTFVSKTVALALRNQSTLVFCDFTNDGRRVNSRGVNSSILLGLLGSNHEAFLVHRRAYDLYGPYSESYRIVSDVLWMREAFKKGARFDHIPESLLNFSDGGLSSGGTSAHRTLLISEISRIYAEEFGFLKPADAELVYLLRFDPYRLPKVLALARKHADKRFNNALANYLVFCFQDKEKFHITGGTRQELLGFYLEACEKLGIPKNAIRMETGAGCFSDFINSIDRALALRKAGSRKTILHFVSVFSAPSETFIYDLLLRLEETTAFDNFVLFDQALLRDARPFAKGIHIPWDDLRPAARNALYQHLFESLGPDLVIGHFAANTWKLERRIAPLEISVPVLSMTHGIDVFSLQTSEPYREFILNRYAVRNDTRFTAVSCYLRDKLIEFGVDAGKIDLVHNSINPRFRAHRKSGNFRTPGDPVKLLAIGRLIDLKGHRHLIQALSIVAAQTPVHLTLTLVYGTGDDLLQELSSQIRDLDLESRVDLVPFVDFEKDPDFFSRYDLFVHPSTYSADALARAESFGMSVLEAIAAGLPVIVTDAGGVPEVVGESNPFARIVPHGDPNAFASAILEAIQDPTTFGDNLAYADQRLALFSEKGQLLALAKSIYRVLGAGIEAALFSTTTFYGAGYAAYRLHRGLLAGGVVTPTIHTTLRHHKNEPGVRVIPHPTMRDERWNSLQKPGHSRPNLTMFTVNHPTILNSKLAEWIETSDIINLHWTARLLSIENIAYLTRSGKPVVLTLRDMFPITGGCHSFHGCSEWMRDCNNCPQLVDHWDNFPAKVLGAKRRNYDFENLTLVALSRHSAGILKRAPLFQDCRIEVIPNSIETEVFQPRARQEARARFGLPQDRKIIAYVPSFSSEVKGYREAVAALVRLKALHPELNPLILLVGRQMPDTSDIPYDKQVLGYIQETESLSYAYSAADVVIVPSLEETFSNTTAEAISCGTPVVGFKTGAIPELAIDDQTGYTVELGDTNGFAEGISKVLHNHDMGPACRKFAETHLRFDLQARRYEDLFTELLALRPPALPTTHPEVPETFPETTATIVKLLKAVSSAPPRLVKEDVKPPDSGKADQRR